MISSRVTCPYCGYKLPLIIEPHSSCNGLSVQCKGRHCKRTFILIVSNGIQKNLMPDKDLIEDFQNVFGSDYKEHIRKHFGVII